MTNKITMEGTLKDHAKTIRQFAETTAKHSKNWENFEELVLIILQSVYEAGEETAEIRFNQRS